MRAFFSTLLFTAFLLLSGWEVLPKFYQKATCEVAAPLFVASTKLEDTKKGTSHATEEKEEIDYRQLTKGMNTKGA